MKNQCYYSNKQQYDIDSENHNFRTAETKNCDYENIVNEVNYDDYYYEDSNKGTDSSFDELDDMLSIPETIPEEKSSLSGRSKKSSKKSRSKSHKSKRSNRAPSTISSENKNNLKISITKHYFPNNDTQEPWPKDVKLYQPYEVEQILLPDNANCLAVQAFLKMCNLNFEVVSRSNAEFMSPTGKVPFIRCGAFVIAELEGIVQFVNNKGISLTSNIEPEQKSDLRAYMSLVHNVLENAELYICWCDKETYSEVTKPRTGSVYPWPLNHIHTWSKRSAVCKKLKMMGWYNKTLEDVFQEVENCCQALTDRLEGKEYFFGKRMTEMDALVYGHIYSLLNTPLPAMEGKLTSVVKRYDKLIEHCKKIHYFIQNKEIMLESAYTAATSCTHINQDNIYPLSPGGLSDVLNDVDSSESDHSFNYSLSDVDTDDLILQDNNVDIPVY